MKVIHDADLLNGNPFIEGTMFTVYDVIAGCDEVGLQAYLAECPELSYEAIQAAAAYCRQRQCDRDHAWCTGCSLRTQSEGVTSLAAFIAQFEQVQFLDSDDVIRGSGSGIIMLPGTPDEMDLHWRGEHGWALAEKLAKKFAW